MPHNRAVQLFFLYLGLILVSVTTAYPLLWMVAVSLQAPGAELSGFRVLLPSSVTLESYRVVFLETGFLRAFLNSVFVTVGVTAGRCSPAVWRPTRSPGCVSSGVTGFFSDIWRQ